MGVETNSSRNDMTWCTTASLGWRERIMQEKRALNWVPRAQLPPPPVSAPLSFGRLPRTVEENLNFSKGRLSQSNGLAGDSWLRAARVQNACVIGDDRKTPFNHGIRAWRPTNSDIIVYQRHIPLPPPPPPLAWRTI